MSMISGLIDELRKSADEWNGSNMFELARMCSEAADTIWQLRDDLQRANAENAKLRELIAEVYPYAKAFLKEGVMLGCIDSKSHDWFLQLRELGIEVGE